MTAQRMMYVWILIVLQMCRCVRALTEEEADAQYKKDLTAVVAGTVCTTLFLVALIICIGYLYYRLMIRKINRKYETLRAELNRKHPFGTPGKNPSLGNYFTKHENGEENIFYTEAPVVEITPIEDQSPKRFKQWPRSEMSSSMRSLAFTEGSSFRGEDRLFGSLLQSPLKVPSLYSEDFADTSMNESLSHLDDDDDVFADLNEPEEYVVIHIRENQQKRKPFDSIVNTADETNLSGATEAATSDSESAKRGRTDTNGNDNSITMYSIPEESPSTVDNTGTTLERSRSFLETMITALDEEEHGDVDQPTVHVKPQNRSFTVKRLDKKKRKVKHHPSVTYFTRHFSMNAADYSRSTKTQIGLNKFSKLRKSTSFNRQARASPNSLRTEEHFLGNIHFFSNSFQEPTASQKFTLDYISPVRGRNMHLARRKSIDKHNQTSESGHIRPSFRQGSGVMSSRPSSMHHRSRGSSATTEISSTGIDIYTDV